MAVLLAILLLLVLLAAEHVGIERGGEVLFVVALVVGEPEPLPLRLADFPWSLLLAVDVGHEQHLVVIGLEGIHAVDAVKGLLRGAALEDIHLTVGMLSHDGIVFLGELRAELLYRSLVVVVLHHVEVHADVGLVGMDGKGAAFLRACGQCPLAVVVFKHGDA